MKDEVLVCADCEREFAWTVGEQDFYKDKGISEPQYCMICKGKQKAKISFNKRYNDYHD
ncbi:zinc-ribbon domain containing protein [Patescibacteria group bacterium]